MPDDFQVDQQAYDALVKPYDLVVILCKDPQDIKRWMVCRERDGWTYSASHFDLINV